MTTKLKSITQFAAVPPGVPTSLPHGLNIDGDAVFPDEIKVDNGDFSATANDTSITVINQSAAPASCNVLAEHWHTIERAFGNVATLNLSPQPFSTAGGAADAISSPAISFVYRPGGVPAGNVYTDFALLEAAMKSVAGPKILTFDPSIAPCVIGPRPGGGMWEMKGVTWLGYLVIQDADRRVDLTIAEGAQFSNLRNISGTLKVINTATATIPNPASDFAAADGVFLGGGAFEANGPLVLNAGTVPFWDFTGKGVSLVLEAGMILGASPAIQMGAGSFVQVVVDCLSNFGSDMVAGAAGTLLLIPVADNAGIGNQTVFAGTAMSINVDKVQWNLNPGMGQPAAVAPVPAIEFTDCVRINAAAGAIAQPLPSIANSASPPVTKLVTGGASIIIKETSGGANPVNVFPAAGDTIDGGAGPLVVPPGGSRILCSDGVSNWYCVGGYL